MNLYPIWIHLSVAQTVFWRSSMFLDSVHFHSSSFWFNDHHLSLFLLFISCSPLINPHQLFQPNRHARSLESLFYHQKHTFIRFSDISIEKGAFYHHLCSDQRWQFVPVYQTFLLSLIFIVSAWNALVPKVVENKWQKVFWQCVLGQKVFWQFVLGLDVLKCPIKLDFMNSSHTKTFCHLAHAQITF